MPKLLNTRELQFVYSGHVDSWKEYVKGMHLKYSALCIPLMPFTDSEDMIVFNCEPVDVKHLKTNLTFYISHGVFPLAVMIKRKFLHHKQIDKLRAAIISEFKAGSVAYDKVKFKLGPTLEDIKTQKRTF